MRAYRGRSAATWTLIALLLFQGISGLAGGWGMTFDPTGSDVGLDPALIEGSPFPDFFIPGVILLVVLGVVPVVVAVAVWRRAPWAQPASWLVGLALLGWLAVEILVVGYIARPPLQLVYGLVGLGIVLTAALPPARRDLRAAPPHGHQPA